MALTLKEQAVQPAEMPSDLTEFDPGYYGWRVVLAACLGVMAGFGSLFVYTFAVFVKPLSAQFGWNRESISLGFAIGAMTVGLTSPLIGRLLDRLGPRPIILPCMTVFGCGIASLSLLGSKLWQFYATCFVIGLVGRELHPLSHLVQAMRRTRQTSEFIAKMGPFFIGYVLHRTA